MDLERLPGDGAGAGAQLHVLRHELQLLCRWYYMPVLIMCAVTVYGLEHEDEVDLKKGLRPTLAVLLAYCASRWCPPRPTTAAGKIRR